MIGPLERCGRCKKHLAAVRYEMYSTKAARDAAARMYGRKPNTVLTAGFIGTYGGICYYRHRKARLETAGGLSFRRVVRMD